MVIPSKPTLSEFLSSENKGFIAVRKKYANDVPKDVDDCLSTVREFGDFSLLEKHGQCGLRDPGAIRIAGRHLRQIPTIELRAGCGRF